MVRSPGAASKFGESHRSLPMLKPAILTPRGGQCRELRLGDFSMVHASGSFRGSFPATSTPRFASEATFLVSTFFELYIFRVSFITLHVVLAVGVGPASMS